MTHRHLPPGTQLKTLKGDAKALLKSVKAGEPDALERVDPYFDNPSHLQQMQLVIAREYGFESWKKLKSHIAWTKLKSHVALSEKRQLTRGKVDAIQERQQAALPDPKVSGRALSCSFCGLSQHDVAKLIAGPSVYICDECVDLCVNILRDEAPAPA